MFHCFALLEAPKIFSLTQLKDIYRVKYQPIFFILFIFCLWNQQML